MSRAATRGGMWPVTLAGAAVVVTTALPNQLLGALAPLVKRDLGFGDSGLGVIYAAGFAAAALLAGWGGGLADRVGSRFALRAAAAVSGLALLAISAAATSMVVLLVLMVVASYGNATGMPASNTYIVRGVPPTRLGLGMGTKLAAVPAASALAGLTVPLVGETVGWRWAFGGAGVLALVATTLLPRVEETPQPRRTGPRPGLWRRPHLFSLAVGGAFATAGVITIPGFLVTAAEESGFATGTAGLLFTGGGVILIVVRIGLGFVSDRHRFDRFSAVALLIVGGCLGFALMATGAKVAVAAATPLLFGLGWSWPALFHLGIVDRHPEAPGAASGVIQTGFFVGGIVGPLAFGFIAEHASIEVAWWYSAATSLIGAALIVAGGRLASRGQCAATDAPAR